MSPKLSRGQIAPGIKNLRDEKYETARKIIKALEHAISSPTTADTSILEAARSQSDLDKFLLSGKIFSPVSPNTFKKHCKLIMPGGWEKFKGLRAQAYFAYCKCVEKEQLPGANTKEALSLSVQTYKQEVRDYVDAMSQLIFMYLDLYSMVKDLQGVNKTIKTRFDEHVRRFDKTMMGLRLVAAKKNTTGG